MKEKYGKEKLFEMINKNESVDYKVCFKTGKISKNRQKKLTVETKDINFVDDL